jgi:hypothetical protein
MSTMADDGHELESVNKNNTAASLQTVTRIECRRSKRQDPPPEDGGTVRE